MVFYICFGCVHDCMAYVVMVIGCDRYDR
eukprot:COSAG05_NODE_7132_length_852_cov_1.262948_1_plen_28_part_10